MTDTQLGCLEALAILTKRLGRAPSAREVAAQLGIDYRCATRMMHRLEALGLIMPPVPSGWTLTAKGKRAARI